MKTLLNAVLCLFKNMVKKIIPLVLVLFALVQYGYGQTTYKWIGSSNGSWITSSNWSPTRNVAQPNDILVFDNGASITVTDVPTQTIRRIIVESNTSVVLQGALNDVLTINGPNSATNIQVDAGASLQISNGTNKLALSFNTTTNQYGKIDGTLIFGDGGSFTSLIATNYLNIDGKLLTYTGSTFNATSAIVTINGELEQAGGTFTSSAANLKMGAGMVYNHTANGGQVPTATWDTTTELYFTGIIDQNVIGLSGQTVGAVTYNSIGQTASNILLANTTGTTVINGDFIVQSTGSVTNAVELFTTTGSMIIYGNFIVQTGILNINTANSTNSINIYGDLLVHTNGTFTRTGATGTATITLFGENKQFNASTGTLNTETMAFIINAGASITLFQNIEVTSARAFTVNGILNLGTNIIHGAGTFTLAGTVAAGLITAHPQGINLVADGETGSIQTTGGRTFGNTNYEYTGQVAQVTGTGLPASIRTLTINNAHSDGVILTNPLIVTTDMYLTQGRLLLGNNDLSLSSTTGSIIGNTSTSTMIVTNGTGLFRKNFPTGASNFTFPIGEVFGTPEYSPVTFSFNTFTTGGYIGLRVVNEKNPNLMVADNYISRYWVGTSPNLAHNLDITFHYYANDVVGSDNNFVVNHFNEATSYWKPTDALIENNTVTFNTITANGFLPLNFQFTLSNPTPVYYRNKADGNWDELNNWEVSSDIDFVNPPPTDALNIPNNLNSDGIIIKTGTTITASTNQTVDDVFVYGTLIVPSGVTFTILNGPADYDMIVYGTLINDNSATSKTIIVTTGALYFADGSTYEHRTHAGVIPTATWDAGSTCKITGSTTAVPSGLNPTGGFGNFIWNAPNQSLDLTTGNMTVKGNFNIEKTGAGINVLFANGTLNVGGDFNMNGGEYHAKTGTTGSATINVTGDFNMNSGYFSLNRATTGSGTLNVYGNLELKGGTFDFSKATSTGIGTVNCYGNYNQDGTTVTVGGTGTGICVLNLNGSNTQYNYVSGTLNNTRINYNVNAATAVVTLNADIALAPSRSFAVIANGTLFCGNYIISGGSSNTFTLNSGSTLGIGSPDGITLVADGAKGNIQTTTRTINSAAKFVYNGNVPQVIGSAVSSAVMLRIDNPNGVTLSKTISVTGTVSGSGLILDNGVLTLDNYNLTVAAATPVEGNFSSTTHVKADGTGQFIKTYAAGIGAFTFPIGDGTNYSPVTLEFTLNGAGNIGFRTINTVHPNNGVAPDYIERYFVSTSSVGTPYRYNLSFKYPEADVVGQESNMMIQKWNGSAWSIFNSIVEDGEAVSIQTLNNTNAPLTGTSHFTVRTAEVNYYRTVDSGLWSDVSIWEVSTNPDFSGASTPAAAPTKANSVLAVIREGHEVSYNAATTIYDLYVYGKLINNSGSATLTPDGAIYMKDNSEYIHNRDGGAIITALWDTSSVCKIIGVTNTMVTGVAGQSFGHFIWDNIGQTASITTGLLAAASTTNFQSFELRSSNGHELRLSSSGAQTINIAEDFEVNNGTLNIKSQASTVNINVNGNLYIASGATLTQSSTNTGTTFTFTGVDKSFTNDGTFNSLYINYAFSAPAKFTMYSNIELGAGRTLNVNAGATLIMNDDIVLLSGVPVVTIAANGTLNTKTNMIRSVLASPIGTFTLSANARLITGHEDGVVLQNGGANGCIQTATRTYTAGAHFEYLSTAKNTGTGLGYTANGTVANPVSVTFRDCDINLTSPLTISVANGELKFDNAKVKLGNNNISLTSATVLLTGEPFSVDNMIITNGTGQFIRAIPATATLNNPYVYPVGTEGAYTPVSLEFETNDARNIGVRVVDSKHPEVGDIDSYLKRHWIFSNGTTKAMTYKATFKYEENDIIGNEAQLLANLYQADNWYAHTTNIDVSANTFTYPESGYLNHILPTVGNSLTNTSVTLRGTSFNPNYHFRTVKSGNWSDFSIWEVSTDPTFVNPAPISATYYPKYDNAKNINIVAGHQITLDIDVQVDEFFINDASNSSLTIPVGKTLTAGSFGNAITIATSVPRLIVDGTLVNEGVISGGSASNFFFNNGATYIHQRDGGTIPTATWAETSDMKVVGIVSTNLGGMTQNFGNVIWDCPNQTIDNPNLQVGTATWKGDFIVNNTGSGSFCFRSSANTAIGLTIQGDFIIEEDAKVNIKTTAAPANIYIGGMLKINGGILTQTSTTVTTFYFTGANSSFVQNSGTFNTDYIDFKVNAGANFALNSPLSVKASRVFTIVANGTMNMNANVSVGGTFTNEGRLNTNIYLVQGAGTFIQGGSAAKALLSTLSLGSTDGFSSSGASGNIQTTTRTFTWPSNYIYESTVGNMGNGYTVAATQANMTFNACTLTIPTQFTAVSMTLNDAKLSLDADIFLNGTNSKLSMTKSKIQLGDYNLRLNTAGHILEGEFDDDNMIVTNGNGYFYRQIPATASLINPYVYPIGSGEKYSPAIFNFTTTATGALGMRTTDQAHPNIGSSSAYLNRYWTANISSGLALYTYSAELHYPQSDVIGDESTMLANYYDGSDWTAIPSIVDISDDILYFPSIGTLTQTTPLHNRDFTGRYTKVQYAYRSIKDGDWSDLSTWEISTDVNFINPAPIPATEYPTADNSILIRIWNGNEINLDIDVEVDQMELANTVNTTLNILSDKTMTILDDVGNDLTIGSNARMYVYGNIINQGQIYGSSATTTIFMASSSYEHKQDGGLIPISTWNESSTLLITGLVNTNPTALGSVVLGNFIYNCEAQEGNLNLGFTTTTFNGNLTIESTGTGQLVFASSTSTLNMNGNFILNGGTVGLNGYTGANVTTVNLKGDFSQIGTGRLYPVLGTASGTQAWNFVVGPDRTFYCESGTFDALGLMNMNVALNAELTLLSNIDLGIPPSGTRTFTNNGTLWLGSNIISGGLNTTFANTAAVTTTLGIGHPQGIALVADGAVGNIQTQTTRTYGTTANYVYNGTEAQITGSGLTTCNNLTISNSEGVLQHNNAGTTQNVTVTLTLDVTGGEYDFSGSENNLNTLTINGTEIYPLASNNLLSNKYSNLIINATGIKPDLYIPASITELNALTIGVAAANSITLNHDLTLYSPSTVALTLSSGKLVLGDNNLTILSTLTNAISSGSISAMVVADGDGYLRRSIPANIATSTVYVFPIGDLTDNPDYSPVSLAFTQTSATPAYRIIGVRVRDMQHPSDGTSNDYITRYWSFTDSEHNNGTYTYNPTFTYSTTAPSDLVGTAATLKLNRWDGSLWTQYVSTISSPSISATGLTKVTSPLHNNDFTGRFNSETIFVWQATDGGSYDFQDPFNWLPARVSPQTNDVLSFSKGGSSIANNVPTQSVGKVIVSNETNITLEGQVGTAKILSIAGPSSSQNLTIAAGSDLQLGGTVQLTLNITTNANQTANIAGNLVINNNGTLNNTFTTSTIGTTLVSIANGGNIINNGGIVTATVATLNFADGGTYTHAMNGGVIPIASWHDNSNLIITGLETTNLTWHAGPFGNVTWDCANQTTATGAISACTINGDISVLNGIMFDNGVVVTGNSIGTFYVADGATYKTNRTSNSYLPTNFVNFSLQPNSIIEYAGTSAHTIPVIPDVYGVLLISGNVVKTLSSDIEVNSIKIITASGTLADGGYKVTGTGLGAFYLANSANYTITNESNNPMPDFNEYVFEPLSKVNFNALADQEISNIPNYGYLAVAGAANKKLIGTTSVQTQVITASGSELDLNGKTLYIQGATPFSNSGVLIANAFGSTIELNSANLLQTLTIAGTIKETYINNLTIANTFNSGVPTTSGVVIGSNPTAFFIKDLVINNDAILNLAGRRINILNAINNDGLIVGNASGSTIAFTGSSSQTVTLGNLQDDVINGLAVDNVAGITLGEPINVSGTLTLTNGLINTTSTNILTITNTTVAAIATGSAFSYVNGPLARNIPLISSGSNTYRFPIGKGYYNQVELLNLRTSELGTIVAEVFDVDCEGTPGQGLMMIDTNKYWLVKPTTEFVISGNIKITEQDIGLNNRIAQSDTINGVYESIGGSYSVPAITATASLVSPSLGYFVLANTGMTYTSSTVTQALTTVVAPGSTSERILRIQIVLGAGTPALKLEGLKFNTNGSTSATDIAKAKVYYTGSSTTFATDTQFGVDYNALSGTFIVNGDIELSSGTSYFWLAYDIASDAILGNVVDAECTDLIFNYGTYTPTVTAPAGNRLINLTYCNPGSNALGPCDCLITCGDYSISTVNITSGGSNYFSYSGGSCISYTYLNLSNNNYDGPAAPLIPGQSYTLTITKSGGSNKRVRVWIDWNNNGSLSDGDELILNTTVATPTVNFTIPSTAPAGLHRMRIAMGDQQNDNPCYAGTESYSSFVEYRDFSVKFASPCDFPNIQASNFSYNSLTTTSVNVTFDRGNGDGGVIVLAKAGSVVNGNPTSGNTYTANSSFGQGDQIGTGNYVVYSEIGSGSGQVTVPVTNLTPGVTYHFAIFEYNDSETCYNLSQLSGSVDIPLCFPPTTQAGGSYTENAMPGSIDILWTENGDGDGGVIVFVRAGNPISTHPSQTINYNANSVWPLGSQIGTTGARAVYKGDGDNVTVTDLPVNTKYHYAIYSYNSSTDCYLTPPDTGSFFIPYCFPPTTQLSNVQAKNITYESADLSWIAGGGDASFVLLKEGSAVNVVPVLTTPYTANSVFGSGQQLGTANYVIHSSDIDSVKITNLIPNTTYHYAAYTYYEDDYCYMLPAVTGSFTTADGPMVYVSSTTIQQTGDVAIATTNQPIIRVQIVTGTGTDPELNLESLTFNTNGSTSDANMTSAKVFYTGSSATFSSTTQFGATILNPSGSNKVEGTQKLIPGVNYFWITYDIAIGATVGHKVDAECTEVNVGVAYTPSVTAPSGSRTIVGLGSLLCAYVGSNINTSGYSSIAGSGATQIASGSSLDDQQYPNISFPSGFKFEFDGVEYEEFGVNVNGFIWFGDYIPSSGNTYNPISTTLPFDGVISAFGADLWAKTGLSSSPSTPQINTNLTGTAPNRVFTIEWAGFVVYPTSQGGMAEANRIDFQIKLYEKGGSKSNHIEFWYRNQSPFFVSASQSGQVGLRGTTNADFNNRQASAGNWANSTAGTSNTATCQINTSFSYLGSNNLGFRFVPNNVGAPIVTPSPTAENVCPETFVELSNPTYSVDKQWYKDNLVVENATNPIFNATESGTYLLVVSNGSGCSRVSTPVEVTIIPCLECVDVISPVNLSIDNELNIVLEWTALDSVDHYNVYFDTVNPPNYATSTVTTSYLPYIANYNTTYYWRINSVVNGVETGDCTVSSFKTKSLDCPVVIAPENNAIDIDIDQVLYWEAMSGNVWYSVYFGTENPPPLVVLTTDSLYANTYNPGELDLNTTYYWKVVPHTLASSVDNCEVHVFTTIVNTSILDLVWTGAVNSEWNNANNWEPKVVPTSTNNVTIPSDYANPPIVNANKNTPARTNNMIINLAAKLTIDPDMALTIHGDLTNSGTIHIRSVQDPAETIHYAKDGSLIVLGNRSEGNNYKIDRYFSGSFWHMISSPITSAKASVFSNLWLREYDESQNAWGAFVTNLSTPLTVGKGFIVWSYDVTDTRTFTGTINHGSIPINVQYTANPSLGPHQRGWNLVGNPYPSAVEWANEAAWNKTNIAKTLYVYSAAKGNYLTWNPAVGGQAGTVLAMGQGFFVQASSSNPALTIYPEARVHHSVTFRNELANSIQIDVKGNNYSDHNIVVVMPDASIDYDFDYDAVKLSGLAEAPQLYTLKKDASLAVNAVQSEENIVGMTLYLEVGVAAEYELTYAHTLMGDNILILDKITSQIIRKGQTYRFVATPTDRTDRFEFVDESTILSADIYTVPTLPVWADNNFLYIGNLDNEILKTIEIYDILGAKVLLSSSYVTDLNILQSGVYNVKVYTDKQIKNVKVVVN